MNVINSGYRIVIRRSNKYQDIHYAQVKFFGFVWVDCYDLDFWIGVIFPKERIKYSSEAGIPESLELHHVEKYIENKVFKNKQEKVERIRKNLKVVRRY